jgi:integrase
MSALPTTPLAPANAPSPDPAELLRAWIAYLETRGRRVSKNTVGPARRFLRRWPDPQAFADEPLEVRLGLHETTFGFLSFLMVEGHLRPGYDFLLARKFSRLWSDLAPTAIGSDIDRFATTAEELGYGVRTRAGTSSQAMGRILLQTGKRLEELNDEDVDAFDAAVAEAQLRSDRALRHYTGSAYMAKTVLYHLGILSLAPSPLRAKQQTWAQRMGSVPPGLRDTFVSYLERLSAVQAPGTVTSRASRLGEFGRFLARVDPGLETLAQLDRCRHIEPYLSAVAEARNSFTGAPISVSERRLRIFAVRCMLEDIAEWGWPDAPVRRLVFSKDLPRLPRPLPRYLPLDADRRLVEVLATSPNRLVADALLLQRACGLRIGELLDLELDCVHEVPGQGAWLKVPLGKLDTERMVPLDEETVEIVDRIVANRSPGRPLRHPRSGRLVEFLFTHHGRRVSAKWLRKELDEAAAEAGLGHAVPHQLRHTYATALVNAGVSLQTLMVLLGHVSAAMSLRYGRLFDATVRTEYERALVLAKERLGPVLPQATPVEINTDWRQAPAIKARLAGGFCLRAVAQGPCPYANICEHCPNFRSDPSFLAVLGAQRVDAEALAADAEARGWAEEAERHRRLVERIELHMTRAQAG